MCDMTLSAALSPLSCPHTKNPHNSRISEVELLMQLLENPQRRLLCGVSFVAVCVAVCVAFVAVCVAVCVAFVAVCVAVCVSSPQSRVVSRFHVINQTTISTFGDNAAAL